MPYTTEYITKEDGVIFRWSGIINAEEIIESYHVRFDLVERMEKLKYVMIDYTDAVDVKLSAEDIKTLSGILLEEASKNILHDIYGVVIAPSDTLFGMVRMGHSYSDDSKTGWHTYVVRSREEGEDWLRSNLDNKLTFRN